MKKTFEETRGGYDYMVDKLYHPAERGFIFMERDVKRYIGWKRLRDNYYAIRARLMEIKGIRQVSIGDGFDIEYDASVPFEKMRGRINSALCISHESFGSAHLFKEWCEEHGF
jgi:hypothetical protein